MLKEKRKEMYDLLKEYDLDVLVNAELKKKITKILKDISLLAVTNYKLNDEKKVNKTFPHSYKRSIPTRVYIKEPPATDDELSLIS